MNIAHIESKAAPHGKRALPLLVRRLVACGLIGLVAMSAAQAGPRDRERDRDGQGQREANRGQRQEPRQYLRQDPRQDQRQDARQDQRQADDRQPRQYDVRDARANDDQRRIQQQQQQEQSAQNNADAFRRSGRLTPDERRDLRRQINEAGADIYQSRRPRR